MKASLNQKLHSKGPVACSNCGGWAGSAMDSVLNLDHPFVEVTQLGSSKTSRIWKFWKGSKFNGLISQSLRDFFPCNESSLQNRKQGDMKGEMLFPGDLHCTGFGSLIRDTIRQGMMVLVLVGWKIWSTSIACMIFGCIKPKVKHGEINSNCEVLLMKTTSRYVSWPAFYTAGVLRWHLWMEPFQCLFGSDPDWHQQYYRTSSLEFAFTWKQKYPEQWRIWYSASLPSCSS